MATINYDKEKERQRIGTAFLNLRTAQGRTQEEVAETAGITRANLVNVERGKYSPGLDVLAKIAMALHCELVITDKKSHITPSDVALLVHNVSQAITSKNLANLQKTVTHWKIRLQDENAPLLVVRHQSNDGWHEEYFLSLLTATEYTKVLRYPWEIVREDTKGNRKRIKKSADFE